jgi:hypothetical protein
MQIKLNDPQIIPIREHKRDREFVLHSSKISSSHHPVPVLPLAGRRMLLNDIINIMDANINIK